MAKDPICGMTINEQQTVLKSEYKGKMYYFCSLGCKQRFDENPQRYAGPQTA